MCCVNVATSWIMCCVWVRMDRWVNRIEEWTKGHRDGSEGSLWGLQISQFTRQPNHNSRCFVWGEFSQCFVSGIWCSQNYVLKYSSLCLMQSIILLENLLLLFSVFVHFALNLWDHEVFEYRFSVWFAADSSIFQLPHPLFPPVFVLIFIFFCAFAKISQQGPIWPVWQQKLSCRNKNSGYLESLLGTCLWGSFLSCACQITIIRQNSRGEKHEYFDNK